MKKAPGNLREELIECFGPLMGGRDLMAALGYRTPSAFSRACKAGLLGVRVFVLPGRKGKFAMTTDVASWLEKASGDYVNQKLSGEEGVK